MTQKPVFVVTNIVDQNLSAATLTLCSNISTSINAASSENGVNYYLRDNSSNAIVSGPYAGTGSALSLSTGIVANTTTFNVLANRVSGGLNFDGVDDYVMANETSAIENLGMNLFTMESWINPNTVTGVRSIIRKDGDYNLYLNNGNVVAEVFPAGGIGGSYYQATTTTTVTPGKWTYVAATWDGTNIAVFINYVNSPLTTGSSSSTLTSKFCIGGATTAGKTFDGKIDEVRLWNTARSVIQLTANIGACLTGTETSLIAYYQFEDGKGSSVLTDKISAGNNGTLVNMDNINAWRGGVENCGCSLTLTQKPVVSVNSSPTVNVNSGAICSGSSFTITPSGATSYTISGGNFTVTPSASTSYSVTGSNTAGCVSAPAIAMVTVNITPTISVNSAGICSGNTAVITPTGAANYTITGNSFTVTPAATTSYSVSGSSTAGCVSSNTAVSVVSVNITPTIAVNSGSLCSGNAFTISPSGATSYTISGGNFTVTPSANTSYSVTGTATNGCVSSNTAVASITVNATPTLAVNSATVCSGMQVTLTPTGADSYTITGNSFTVTPASTTSYSVTGTSTTGCIASNTAVATVSVNTTPTISVNSGSLCSGSSFTIQPAGAAAYTISGGNYTVTPSITTSYSITGSNGSCVSQNTAVATITVNTTPTITVNSATICSGNSVAIVPTGGANYSITGNSFTVSPLNTTSYSVTATSTAACVSNVAVATILVNTSPTVSVNSGAICAGSPFVILPSGANTYTITGNSFTVTPSSTTSYSVSGTAANGCVAMSPAIAMVTVNALPTIVVNGGAVCPGNTFTFTPAGASSYTYSGGSNVVAPTITSSYTITGSSAAGCPASNTAVATVSVVNTLSVFVTGAINICSGQSTTLTANGAATYTWSTFSQGNMITVAPAVTSTYMVVGASGSCSNTAMVTVSVNPIPTISVNSGSICAGGTFTIVPSGATSYTYSGGTPVVSPGITTTFSVTGSSGPGCVSTNTAMSLVTVSPLPNVTASISQSLICLGQPAILMATGAANYTWSDAQTGASVTVSPPVNTTYTVTGISASGCTNTAIVALLVSPCTNIQSISGSSIVFGLYPNPNNGQFVVEAPEHVTIIIQNTIGQVVYSTVSAGPATAMNISSLANGVYFVKAVSGPDHQTIKFIKE